MNPPHVTVAIPNFNGARFLPEAMNSVLEQDFRDYELLICDNQSTDDSRAIVERYAATNRQVRLEVNAANLGAVGNFNRCLALARGEWVKFVCSDDKLAGRQALGRLVAMVESHPTAVLAASARNLMNEHSAIVSVSDSLKRPGLHHGREVVVRCLEQNANLIGELPLCRRRAAARGFDPRYQQLFDLEMWFHLLAEGDLVYSPEPLNSIRQHARQLTAQNRANRAGADEAGWLLRDYYRHAWLKARLTRRALFTQIYYLRKHRSNDPDLVAIEAEMLASLGRGRYAALWLAHKTRQPLRSLTRVLARLRLRRTNPPA